MAQAPGRPRAPKPMIDPSSDAAGLLRRLGFAVLMIGVPSAALLARRGTVLMVPIGVSLLVLAALLDGGYRDLRSIMRRLAGSPGVVAFALGLLWIVISLLWTPARAAAYERAFSLAGTLAAALVGYVALPDRMRSANLYLLPVGVALAAVIALAIATLWPGGTVDFDAEGQSLERGVTVLTLFVWPAIAWLRSRERDVEALTLSVLVATAVVVINGHTPVPLALAVGAVAYALASLWPAPVAKVVAAGMALLVVTAPLLWIPAMLSGSLLSRIGLSPDGLQAWGAIVVSDPVRLLVGHGFETFQHGRITGLVPPGTPGSILFQIWYELGLVGALAAAAVLWTGPRAGVTSYSALSSGVTAAYATVFVLAALGVGAGQMWLLTAFSALVLAFVATERGQFRTERPRAMVFRAARGSA